MPLFELDGDRLDPIQEGSFVALGIGERSHLQRALRDHLEAIAPNCMLISEEFGAFEGAWRRIDLLAMDRDRGLVVIELKRTEDGGHAELQAIRYAAMVSMMTFDQAVEAHDQYLRSRGLAGDARDRMLSFLELTEAPSDFPSDVRIVLASANFSKELTTSVLWLRDRDIDISCVRVRPYAYAGKTILDIQKVIPLPETAEYQTKIREREQARIEAVASERNQKYEVVDGEHVETQLYKRQALHRLVKALARRGVTPEQMMNAVPSKNAYLFVSAQGSLRGREFMRAAREQCIQDGRAFDHRRFFVKDDELIVSGDRTYAVTNQVGSDIEIILGQLSGAFPFPDLEWRRVKAEQ